MSDSSIGSICMLLDNENSIPISKNEFLAMPLDARLLSVENKRLVFRDKSGKHVDSWLAVLELELEARGGKAGAEKA